VFQLRTSYSVECDGNITLDGVQVKHLEGAGRCLFKDTNTNFVADTAEINENCVAPEIPTDISKTHF